MNHIIYHIVSYTVVFFCVALALRNHPIIIAFLIPGLAILGEMLQIPLREYFWFVFELEDISNNLKGACIGTITAMVYLKRKGGGANEDHGSIKEASQ